MRRAPIVLAATVAGFAGVLSFHTSGTTVTLGTSGTGSTSSTKGAGSHPSTTSSKKGTRAKGSASAGSSGSSSTSGGPSGSSGTSGSSGSSGSSGAAGPSGSSGSSSASGASGGAASSGPTTGVRTATGRAENFGYGVLAVKVRVHGSHIADVQVASLRVAEPTSQQICDEAIPMLRSEVRSAQSAHINAISGATYTSEAYAYSLQSALDKLHVR